MTVTFSTKLPSEISAALAGAPTCRHCRLSPPAYDNGRCRSCHSKMTKAWYEKNRTSVLKARRNVTSPRRLLSALEAIVVEGYCLVCARQDFHLEACCVPKLRDQVREACL